MLYKHSKKCCVVEMQVKGEQLSQKNSTLNRDGSDKVIGLQLSSYWLKNMSNFIIDSKFVKTFKAEDWKFGSKVDQPFLLRSTS